MSPFRMRQKLRSLPFRVSGKEHVTKKLYDSVRTPCIQVSHEKKIVYGGIVRRMSPFRMREKLRSLPFGFPESNTSHIKLYDSVRTPCIQVCHVKKFV